MQSFEVTTHQPNYTLDLGRRLEAATCTRFQVAGDKYSQVLRFVDWLEFHRVQIVVDVVPRFEIMSNVYHTTFVGIKSE